MTTLTRILLIDDDGVDRASVRRALKASDLTFELIEAPDGRTGLELAKAGAFDCVLLDYRLPDLDAFDMLAALLSEDGGRQAVMMLTGEADPETALRLMRAGALDHLAKAGLSPSGLARAIRYAKARREFVGELDAARREAEEKSDALDALNRQKSLLFSIIAHDLRNPFQAILGMSEMLGRAVETGDQSAISRRAEGVRQAASQAHLLMEGLFNWARVQMDTMDVVFEDLDLPAILEDATQTCRQAAADKAITVAVDCPPLAVRSQREMLTTILRNLVSNAVKFTPVGGRVTVRAAPGAAGVLVEVSDTGVGIPPALVQDLFKPDVRTTTTGTAGERGSGLGLLLCRDLAERLGTTLHVRSVLNAGATFSLALPAAERDREGAGRAAGGERR